MRTINLIKRNLLQYLELRSIPKYSEAFSDGILKDPENKKLFDQVKKMHKEYIERISSADMAMSWELANFLLRYCLINKPKTLVDLGSGFSSFVFRLYQKVEKNVVVYSIDDHKEWLLKTKEYLEDQKLNSEHVLHIDEFISLNMSGKFDLVLLDLNYVEVRKNFILSSVNLLRSNGLLIIDDVHKVEFLRDVKRVVRDNGFKLRNIKGETYDELGRFAIALTK